MTPTSLIGKARKKEFTRIVALVTASLMSAFPVKASGYDNGETAITGIIGLVSVVVLIILCVINAQNAKKRNRNQAWAVIYTVLLAILGLFIGASIGIATEIISVISAGILCWIFALLGGGVAFLIAKSAPKVAAQTDAIVKNDSPSPKKLINAVKNSDVALVNSLLEKEAIVDEKYEEEVNLLINGQMPPLPVARPPLPAWARQHDLAIVVERKKRGKINLEVTAKNFTVNWGDGSVEDEYHNIKEKSISHRYQTAGSYAITINAEGLSSFQCPSIDAMAIYFNNCPVLEWLLCYGNELASLDISRCLALKYLYCARNKLSSLDLSDNMALDYLHCENNLLTFLDISNHTALRDVNCENNQLSILNVGNNSALEKLHCNGNRLSKLELNRIFNNLPAHSSSYGSSHSWYAGQTNTPNIFFACGNNPGFNSCNKTIAEKKKWLVWVVAMYSPATLAGTPGQWQEKNW
jgi:hypothetical protein